MCYVLLTALDICNFQQYCIVLNRVKEYLAAGMTSWQRRPLSGKRGLWESIKSTVLMKLHTKHRKDVKWQGLQYGYLGFLYFVILAPKNKIKLEKWPQNPKFSELQKTNDTFFWGNNIISWKSNFFNSRTWKHFQVGNSSFFTGYSLQYGYHRSKPMLISFNPIPVRVLQKPPSGFSHLNAKRLESSSWKFLTNWLHSTDLLLFLFIFLFFEFERLSNALQ